MTTRNNTMQIYKIEAGAPILVSAAVALVISLIFYLPLFVISGFNNLNGTFWYILQPFINSAAAVIGARISVLIANWILEAKPIVLLYQTEKATALDTNPDTAKNPIAKNGPSAPAEWKGDALACKSCGLEFDKGFEECPGCGTKR